MKKINLSKGLSSFLFLILLSFQSCKSPTAPGKDGGGSQSYPVNLSVVEVSCTEAWVKVENKTAALPVQINLSLNNSSLASINLAVQDTVIYLDSLLPNKTYTLEGKFTTNNSPQSAGGGTNQLQLTTLDTTSHNFTWQTFTFGEGASSTLYDVAIIGDNNIWAVGTIYLNDSTGQPDPLPYNAVHWNGSVWEVKRITVNFRGNNITPSLNGIFVFSNNQIWLVGGLAIYGDGNNWTPYDVRKITGYDSLSFTKCWGRTSTDMYFVGLNGSLAHYDGSIWQKIESGTGLNIHDINGFVNPFSSKTEILCVADDPNFQQQVQVISINENNTTNKLDNTGLGIAISSVWFLPGIRYYIVGNGLYEKAYSNSATWSDLNNNRSITPNFMESIRGNGLNDIIVSGAYGEMLHFNGIRWMSLKDGVTSLSNGSFYKAAVKGSIAIAVGFDQNKAVVLIGNRQ